MSVVAFLLNMQLNYERKKHGIGSGIVDDSFVSRTLLVKINSYCNFPKFSKLMKNKVILLYMYML